MHLHVTFGRTWKKKYDRLWCQRKQDAHCGFQDALVAFVCVAEGKRYYVASVSEEGTDFWRGYSGGGWDSALHGVP